MAKNKGYTVPAGERDEFKLLVQRANRTINANLRYIQREDIKEDRTRRELLGDYMDPGHWATQKTAFSRSIRFESRKAYEQYRRHLSRWDGEGAEKSLKGTHRRLYENIVKSLNTTAEIYGQGVLDDSGKLPQEITDRLKKMSPRQLANFFEIADPSEEIEHQSWSYEEYQEGVDRGTFVDITAARLNYLEQIIPPDKKYRAKKKGRKKKK